MCERHENVEAQLESDLGDGVLALVASEGASFSKDKSIVIYIMSIRSTRF